MRRHHVHQTVIQKAVKKAAAAAGLTTRVTRHTLRHCFAAHLLASNTDIRSVQELLGHADMARTMIYTHAVGRGALGVASPLDAMGGSEPGCNWPNAEHSARRCRSLPATSQHKHCPVALEMSFRPA